MEGAELQRVLDTVSLNAFHMDEKKYTQITGESKGDQEKSQKVPRLNEGLDGLPISCKMQILDFLSQEKDLPLITDKSLLLPPVKLLDHLEERKLFFFKKEQLARLESDGYFVLDGFTGDGDIPNQMHAEVEDILKAGKLRRSNMSKGDELWNDKKIRGDLIMWINERWRIKEEAPTLYNLLEKIDALRQELNEACSFNSQKSQVQLTCYPGKGARYVRHLDAYVGGSTRRLTFLYYFNPHWSKGDGGELRLYSHFGPRDIEPLADRLLVFQSRLLEHEVLPTQTKRFAVTMWFY